MAKQWIIVAAISSRAYLQAAIYAGFEVIAIDTFADVDTQKYAKQVLQLPIKNGQFEADAFIKVLQKIDLKKCIGLCYGAGFELQPNFLTEIAKLIPIIGNAPQAVQSCKNPHILAEFCKFNQFAIPTIAFSRPTNTIGWLQKQIGGSGGAHIKAVSPLEIAINQNVYYQKIQAGTPYSCLFLADEKNAQVIGFNEQWCHASAVLPYRFGGAVSHADLSENVKATITEFIAKATLFFGLKGINSCDFLLHENKVYMLEVNPRLSASLQLYSAKKGDLFAAHLQACAGELKQWPTVEKQAKAMHIIYANKAAHVTAKVPTNMDWPDWVCDIPQPDSEIAAGEPICTVLADARIAKLARKKVMQRVALL